MTTTTKVTIKGMLLDGFYWISYCCYGGFIVPMLTDHGMSQPAATAVVTLISVFSFLAQPLTGYICDNFISVKRMYISLAACSIPLLILLPYTLSNLPIALAIMFFLTFTLHQVPGLVDSWIIRLQNDYPGLNYGLCRGTGSLFFAIAAQIMGGVTVAFGHGMRLILGAIFAAIGIVAACTISTTSQKTVHKLESPSRLPAGQTLKIMLGNKPYLFLLITSFLIFLGSSSLGTFLNVFIQDMGGNSSHVGTILAVMAVCEVPGMFLMGLILRRVAAKNVILFAASMYVVRMMLTIFSVNLPMLIAVQILQGLSFALMWPAAMNYVNRLVDDRVRSTSVMTFTAVSLGVSAIFANAIGTWILSATGNVRMVFVFSVISATAGFLVAAYACLKKIFR